MSYSSLRANQWIVCPSIKRIAQNLMKNYSENVHYLDKFTLRKMQMDFHQQSEGLPDSLAAWIETYLRLAVMGVRSEVAV